MAVSPLERLAALLFPGKPLESCDAVALKMFLDDATLWVENYLTPNCPDLDPEKIPVITGYLAAHFSTLTTTGPELVSARRQDIQEQYAQLPGGQVSRFISLAAAFDPCGIIEDMLGGELKFKFRVGRGYRVETGTAP